MIIDDRRRCNRLLLVTGVGAGGGGVALGKKKKEAVDNLGNNFLELLKDLKYFLFFSKLFFIIILDLNAECPYLICYFSKSFAFVSHTIESLIDCEINA